MTPHNSFVDRYIAKVKANPWGAALIVFGTLVIALSSFSDAARNLWSLFSKPSPMEARVELNRLSIEYSEDSFQSKAMEGDMVAVKLFLASGMNPDVIGSQASTALCMAAAEGQLEVVDELLKGEANTRIGSMPALACAIHGWASNALLARLIDADSDPALQQDAIHRAAQIGHMEAVQFLLDRAPELISTRDGGNTLLMNSARSGNLELVKLLIARGAAVHETGEQGQTALHTAADMGHPEVVRLLLDSDAKVNVADDQGMTPLHLAVKTGVVEVPKILIDAGANVNAVCACPDWFGGQATPLLLATGAGRREIVDMLLQADADVNATSKDGWTPLQLSTRGGCGNGQMTQSLLDKGVAPNVRTNADGITPLMSAQMHWCFGATRALLTKGADIHLRDTKGFTALIYAIQSRSLRATRALLDAGAELLKDDVMPDGSLPEEWVTQNMSKEDSAEMQLLVERAYTGNSKQPSKISQ